MLRECEPSAFESAFQRNTDIGSGIPLPRSMHLVRLKLKIAQIKSMQVVFSGHFFKI